MQIHHPNGFLGRERENNGENNFFTCHAQEKDIIVDDDGGDGYKHERNVSVGLGARTIVVKTHFAGFRILFAVQTSFSERYSLRDFFSSLVANPSTAVAAMPSVYLYIYIY